ncbi:dTDP-4-dehydrorhamnose reductase [Simiduia curdlanivorans]|uniref:dTDP-4-dehydrorhamnose reductase n=1 Tax=Simiduia curdlanivorans TaxID=1492769 RepID=A0ABV8V115_9GAMM|nr:dTDP-4-dehydrorhamnose reductase [Simiduia curdlanivorans]MDN3637778.1 dTDP-4-dehydrorhamnose reductase [Simiduia curdlanivorans]
MQIVILGATGQVGQALLSQLPSAYRVLTPSHSEVDFLVPGAISAYLDQSAANLVINCVAYNQVDKAESETALAQRINALAVEEIVNTCARLHIPLVHFSTDYVFPGKPALSTEQPYLEAEAPGPVNFYGQSKYLGEQAALSVPANLVLRVSWVFSEFARNMGQQIANQALQGKILQVATDQFGSPTYAGHIAEVVWALVPELLAGAEGGLYHLSGNEAVSRFQLAQAIVDELILQARVGSAYALVATTQAQWIASTTSPIAQRPNFSALGCAHLAERLGRPLKSWRVGLAALVAGI